MSTAIGSPVSGCQMGTDYITPSWATKTMIRQKGITMSSKKQSSKNDKAISKPEARHPVTQNLDIPAKEQSHPVVIIQRARLAPRSLTPSDVKQLQRTIGNQAVGKLLAGMGARLVIQPKPTIGPAGDDRDKQEADGVAERDLSREVSIAVQRVTTVVNDQAWKHLDVIAGTSYTIVRKDWSPWSKRRLLNTTANTLLNAPLSNTEATSLLATFTALRRNAVGDLDSMIEDVDKAYMKGIPVAVTLGRLNMIEHNIREVVIHRLRSDHRDLKANGLLSPSIDDDFDQAFRTMEIPGSDPHKGGQVVVFANYINNDGGRERVVYKPGNLWIDKLLFGDDPDSIASLIGPDMARYKILQRQRPLAPHSLQEYGYMEFARTETPSTKEEIVSVYRSLGEVLAVAYVFGLRDIHHENFILKKDKILLIDMEAATGTYTGFTAMEFMRLPGKLAELIGKGLVAVNRATVAGIIPDQPTITQAVTAGFRANMTRLSRRNITTAAQTIAQGRTRIVPFKTEDLQRMAGAVYGKIGPRASHRQQRDYSDRVERMVAQAALELQMGGHEDELRRLLNADATKAAFNRGDVPYWMREGNDIYDEEGNRLVQGIHWGRVSSTVAIQTGIMNRRDVTNIAQAVLDLQQQALLYINPAPGQIDNAHATARTAAHHPD